LSSGKYRILSITVRGISGPEGAGGMPSAKTKTTHMRICASEGNMAMREVGSRHFRGVFSISVAEDCTTEIDFM